MSELIKSVFADKYITLKCHSGECLHYTQVPGFVVSLIFHIITQRSNPEVNLYV